MYKDLTLVEIMMNCVKSTDRFFFIYLLFVCASLKMMLVFLLEKY